MSITYTVTEVTKEFVKVKFQDDREVIIAVKTWVDKDWIEAYIRQAFNEVDEGSVDDIPLKVGDQNTIMTVQEGEKLNKEKQQQNKEYMENTWKTDYEFMRLAAYPYINDQIGALVKAVITGDKSELESLNTIIQDVKSKYPKDDKGYTNQEYQEQIKTSPTNKRIVYPRQYK